MAPVTRSGSGRGVRAFGSGNVARPPLEPHEVIELDDDDDDQDDGEQNEEVDYNDDGIEEVVEEGRDAGDYQEADAMEETDNIPAKANSMLKHSNSKSTSSEQDFQLSTEAFFTSTGAQQALHPLRRTADRVTRQMEAFADRLDRFRHQEHRSKHQMDAFQAAYSFVKDCQVLVLDEINENKRQNTLRRAKMGWNDLFRDSTATPKSEEELQRLHLENETWDLLLNVMTIEDPSTQAHCKMGQETVFTKLHRYSPDREVWEQFLDADQHAREYVVVMKWLEHTARSFSQGIDSLIRELENQAERGEGLWAHGWLYTKEAIKGQKRLRSWPQPLEPDDPGITLSLLSSEKQEPLITQLDPDAVTRQKHGLQKQDQFFERATWLTCWKMLRQGENWTKIREWSQGRLESWRAVSLCGSSVDAASSASKTPADDSMTRMMNYRSQESWRAACSALARNPDTEDIERAVYALLCGETDPAFKVCESWDDYVYVFYNHMLLSRYRSFCVQFQRTLSRLPSAKSAYVPDPPNYTEIRNFLESVANNERVSIEARNPYRTIQSAILSRSYDSLFVSVANAISATGKSSLTPKTASTHVEAASLIVARDKDALRIVTHTYFVLKSLGFTLSDHHFTQTASVNVIAYIENLYEAYLFDHIPLYASFLPAQLCEYVLGRLLVEIIEPRDRLKVATLIEKHKLDAKAILDSQWEWVVTDAVAKENDQAPIRMSRVVSDLRTGGRLKPVKKDFIGTVVSDEDSRMIRSLEWHKYLHADWITICERGSLLYRRFFASGSLAAARELSVRFAVSEVSTELLGYDATEPPSSDEDGEDTAMTEPFSPSRSPSKKPRLRRGNSMPSQPGITRESIYQQTLTMLELEQLILGFDAIENFERVWEENEKMKNSSDSALQKALKNNLQDNLDIVTARMDPLFDDFLLQARDEREASELEFIRHTYLPEALLNYHNCLYFASLKLDRDIMVQCMNLSVLISTNESLTDCFVSSKRVRELVDALACSSLAMASAPKTKNKKKLPFGARLDIWDIKPEGEEEEEKDEAL